MKMELLEGIAAVVAGIALAVSIALVTDYALHGSTAADNPYEEGERRGACTGSNCMVYEYRDGQWEFCRDNVPQSLYQEMECDEE